MAAADVLATPWEVGRLDARPGPARLLFGRTFEDPAIELAHVAAGGRVLCIASAGDTARALAAAGCSVLAVDVNPAEIAEVRRRLDGGRPRRGAADRLLALGRAALAPAGWRRARLERFCGLDDADAQVAEWDRLTTPVVRRAIDAALSPRVLRLAFGAAFASLVPDDFGAQLIDRVGRRTATEPNRDNPWLSLILRGTWSRPDPTRGTGNIDLRVGEVTAVLEDLPPASLDGISLSNVLDGPGAAFRARLLDAARRAARPGAPIVVRSFLAGSDAAACRLADHDRSLLWGAIDIHRP